MPQAGGRTRGAAGRERCAQAGQEGRHPAQVCGSRSSGGLCRCRMGKGEGDLCSVTGFNRENNVLLQLQIRLDGNVRGLVWMQFCLEEKPPSSPIQSPSPGQAGL